MVALIDMPGDDLRLFQALAKIRQCELTHASSPSMEGLFFERSFKLYVFD
jgi:hypothetical protein